MDSSALQEVELAAGSPASAAASTAASPPAAAADGPALSTGGGSTPGPRRRKRRGTLRYEGLTPRRHDVARFAGLTVEAGDPAGGGGGGLRGPGPTSSQPGTPRGGHAPAHAAGAVEGLHGAGEAIARLHRANAFQSADFDPRDNDLEREAQVNRTHADYQRQEAFKWVLSALIGLAMGLIAFLVDTLIEGLNYAKFESAERYIRAGSSGAGAFFVMLSLVVVFAAIAGAAVAWVEPLAAGSGIPELKTYLNGVHLKGLLQLKTLFAKLGGISFTIASGLIAGKEGPFVHGGGIVGGGIGQMGSRVLGFALPRRWGGYFRNEADHRDFVAIGTAAGVATAFGAPIGGLLFTIEEGCSFYSTSIFWRGFAATCIGVYTLHFLAELKEDPAGIFRAGMGIHRDFGLYADNVTNYGEVFFYYFWEIPIFVLMGATGGLLGAVFVSLNIKITQIRQAYIPVRAPVKRHLETIFMAVITLVIFFSLSYTSPCAPLPANLDQYLSEDVASELLEGGVDDPRATANGTAAMVEFPQLWCPPGTYSAWGQFFFAPLASTLKKLIHLGEHIPGYQHEYPLSSVGLFFFITYCLMTWTYGVGAPTGLFVPSLAVGAAMGQLFGRLVAALIAPTGIEIHLPVYAVIGAAASLGGATRMTLSITVLVVETTGAIQLTVPIMLTIFAAKLVGDTFTLGIYDTHIKIRGAPLLEEDNLNSHQKMMSEKLSVTELMAEDIVSVPEVVQVKEVIATLRGCKHGGFPVTPHARPGALGLGGPPGAEEDLEICGYITRKTLLRMLKFKIGIIQNSSDRGFAAEAEIHTTTRDIGEAGTRANYTQWNTGVNERTTRSAFIPGSQKEKYDLLEKLCNAPDKVRPYKDQDGILDAVPSGLQPMYMDLRPFMQRHPYVVPADASMARVYRLFRTMGLRHVFVGPQHPCICGILTRKDLMEENCALVLGERCVEGLDPTSPLPAGSPVPYMAGMDPYRQGSGRFRARRVTHKSSVMVEGEP